MAEKGFEEFAKFIAEQKGKRKFKQSVELAVNFTGIDFSKQDNRINLDIMLPNENGKVKSIAVFATDKEIIEKARKNGIEVINGDSVESMGKDSAKLTSLLKYTIFAQPNLMPSIAKSMGQFLGPRNHMPKPLLGNINFAEMVEQIGRQVSLKSRGKYLPTVHCTIGKEDMDPEKLYENANEVVGIVSKKVGQNRMKSVYVKLTMSPAYKIR
jgi:large subunit ribosomal protein L1